MNLKFNWASTNYFFLSLVLSHFTSAHNTEIFSVMRKFYLFFLSMYIKSVCLAIYPQFVLKYGTEDVFMFPLDIRQIIFAVYIPICWKHTFFHFIKYFLDYSECVQDLKVLKFMFFRKRLIDFSYDFLACETFVSVCILKIYGQQEIHL